MRTSTWELLEEYQKTGRQVCFHGEAPGWRVDVQPPEKVRELARKSNATADPFEKEMSSVLQGRAKLTGKMLAAVPDEETWWYIIFLLKADYCAAGKVSLFGRRSRYLALRAAVPAARVISSSDGRMQPLPSPVGREAL